MKLKKKGILTKEELLNNVNKIVDEAAGNGVVFITAGAGDIDAMLQDLKMKIEQK